MGRRQIGDLPAPSESMCAYAAGFFDGEGCIRIECQGRHRLWRLSATVSQNNPLPLLELQKFWGGCLSKRKPSRRGRGHYEWRLNSAQVARFLRHARPFLIVKAKEADIALEFQADMRQTGKGGLTPDQLRRRNEWREQISAAKRISFYEVS